MSEEIGTIRKYTESKTQFASLLKELELSKILATQTQTLDYLRQQIIFDGSVEVTDDNFLFSGKKAIEKGYYLTFEPDWFKLQLWHKLNSPFHISIDSSLHARNGLFHGNPIPIKGYDNGLVGSVSLATGFDGKTNYVTIPHDHIIEMANVKEGFTFHIKFAPCSIDLTNGHPQTIFAKRDPTTHHGFENQIISIIDNNGDIKTKLTFNGKEYTSIASGFLTDPSKQGINKWYDHTVIFNPIKKELDVLIDNVKYFEEWQNPHIIPYPYHDNSWHLGSSSFNDRGFFYGGLGDFRFYHDLKFSYQHNYNLFTNRITISDIPYGFAAVIGHSYIRHGLDLGFSGGFLKALDNGKGFMSGGFLFNSQPIDNTLSLIYSIKTFPKTENDLCLMYDIEANFPVANNLQLLWKIQGGEDTSGLVTNDLMLVYSIVGSSGGQPNCPTGYTWNESQQVCLWSAGGTGGGTEFIPTTLLAIVSDTDCNSITEDTYADLMSKNPHQLLHCGDLTHGSNLDCYIQQQQQYLTPELIAGEVITLGNHNHPNEDGTQETLDQIIAFHNINSSTAYCTARRFRNVYMIAMNTQDADIDNTSGTQYQFVNTKLQEAQSLKNSGQVNWVIVTMHKPFYTPANPHHPPDEEGVRSIYQPLFTTYGVDFVLNGHDHYMARSEPLDNSGNHLFTKTQDIYDFKLPHGQFYMGVVSGRGTYGANTNANFPWVNEGAQGYCLMTIDQTGLVMLVQFIAVDGGTGVIHEFKVSKGAITSGGGTGGNPPVCPIGYHFNSAGTSCLKDTPSGGGGTLPAGQIDANGIKWLYATGETLEVPQSRKNYGNNPPVDNDFRWSSNWDNVYDGWEATFIVTTSDTNISGSHNAMKMWGLNHSGSGLSSRRWYDLGIRGNGDVQCQWEGPHPSNHDFTPKTGDLKVSNVGYTMEGSTYGLKWVIFPVIQNGTALNGGIRMMLFDSPHPALTNGVPNNNWRLLLDTIDDGYIIDPNTYISELEQELEVRLSDTNNTDVYGGGLFARKLVRPRDMAYG